MKTDKEKSYNSKNNDNRKWFPACTVPSHSPRSLHSTSFSHSPHINFFKSPPLSPGCTHFQYMSSHSSSQNGGHHEIRSNNRYTGNKEIVDDPEKISFMRVWGISQPVMEKKKKRTNKVEAVSITFIFRKAGCKEGIKKIQQPLVYKLESTLNSFSS